MLDEIYESPEMIEYGTLIDLAQGGSGNDSESCSSGKYENDEE